MRWNWVVVSGLYAKCIFGIIAFVMLALPSAAEAPKFEEGFQKGLMMGLAMGRLQGQALEGNQTALSEYNRQVEGFNRELLSILGESRHLFALSPMEPRPMQTVGRQPVVLGDHVRMYDGGSLEARTAPTLTPHTLSSDPWIRAQQLSRTVRTPIDYLPEDQRHLVASQT